jgi:predicted alpha/beta superfamily hydrolase
MNHHPPRSPTLNPHQPTPEATTTTNQASFPGQTTITPLYPDTPEGEQPLPLETFTLHSHILPIPEQRTLSIHLPPGYDDNPTTPYPVFYLHDGQNLFDPHTSYVPNRTWQAHTTEDQLIQSSETQPVILVGIANAGLRRMAEYTPTRDPRMGGGEGALYARMILEEIKPFIDHTYRTQPGPENTALGGSSLGGLISLAIGLQHPDIFGKLAVLSPSIWWDRRSILGLVRQPQKPRPRIWLDMGTAEGLRHLRDADLLHQRLLDRGWRDSVDLAYQRDPGAVHDEQAWARRFPNVLRFLFPPQP